MTSPAPEEAAPTFRVAEAYRDRPIRPLDVREVAGWRLKAYGITYGGGPLDLRSFAEGLQAAAASLPHPPVAEGRAGVGFVIFHQGRGLDFLVLGWWDRENELFSRVWTRRPEEEGWRPAEAGETACVWDLQVVAFEREAWVETVLARPGEPAVEAYLSRRLEVGA